METAIFNPPEIFPGFPYKGNQLGNFIYDPPTDSFCLSLDNCRGHEIFKPADSYLFRIWLTYYGVPEYPARKQYHYRTEIQMEKERKSPDRKREQLQSAMTKTEKAFQNAALVFAVVVGCIYVACMVFKFVADCH